MFQILMTRLHEFTVILYALSVLLYFIDFLYSNQKANKVAFWLLAVVWVLQTIFFSLFVIETGRFPVLTIFEGLYFYTWILITLSLVLNRLVKVDFIIFFANLVGFIIMVIHTFSPWHFPEVVSAGQLTSELLFIHITMALLSYGTLSISSLFSLLYIIQYDLLKKKKWGRKLRRIADLSTLEYISALLSGIGVPSLLISLILGLEWAYITIPDITWYDAKIIGSFIVLFAYSIFLYLRFRKGYHGKTLALWNIASFLVILINFFLFGQLSTFHFWYN